MYVTHVCAGGGTKFELELDDFVNAALSVVALATISLLTEPVTTCFYPNISESIQKTVPLLVGLVVAAVCAFGTTPRNGIGFANPMQQAPQQQHPQAQRPGFETSSMSIISTEPGVKSTTTGV